jgi:hypothetical protein
LGFMLGMSQRPGSWNNPRGIIKETIHFFLRAIIKH